MPEPASGLRHQYRIFDRVLESAWELPELGACPEGLPDIRFRMLAASAKPGPGRRLLHRWQGARGDELLSSFATPDGFECEFPGLALFHIRRDGRDITCCPAAGVAPAVVRHLLIDQVIPRIQGELSRCVVHAAMVVRGNGRAIVFVGDSGWGKSTLAAAWLARDVTWISDDSLILTRRHDGLYALPSYPGLRLLPDARALVGDRQGTFTDYGNGRLKQRIVPGHAVLTDAVPVEGVFLLNDPTEDTSLSDVRIEPARGSTAMFAVLTQLFMMDLSGADAARERFAGLAGMLRTSESVYRLDYPRRHGSLPAVCQAIEKRLSPWRDSDRRLG